MWFVQVHRIKYTLSGGFQCSNEILDCRKDRPVITADLVKMAKFVLQNNYFEFNGDVEPQYAPCYGRIFSH